MSDEQEVRDLFNNWIKSTIEGNLQLTRQYITDDAVSLVPRAGEMGKETFAQGAAGRAPENSPIDFELDSKLREIKVFGDQAYLWVNRPLYVLLKMGNRQAIPFRF